MEDATRQLMAKIYREIRWVQKNVRLVRWDPKDYYRKFLTRSVREIIESKETNYMSPCLDLTIVLANRLKRIGIEPQFVIQEITNPYTQHPGFHFAIEITVQGKTHTIDFKTGKEAYFYPHPYDRSKSNPHIAELHLIREKINWENIDATPAELLGVTGRRKWRRFKFVRKKHISSSLKRMKADDSEPLFQRVRMLPKKIKRHRH